MVVRGQSVTPFIIPELNSLLNLQFNNKIKGKTGEGFRYFKDNCSLKMTFVTFVTFVTFGISLSVIGTIRNVTFALSCCFPSFQIRSISNLNFRQSNPVHTYIKPHLIPYRIYSSIVQIQLSTEWEHSSTTCLQQTCI